MFRQCVNVGVTSRALSFLLRFTATENSVQHRASSLHDLHEWTVPRQVIHFERLLAKDSLEVRWLADVRIRAQLLPLRLRVPQHTHHLHELIKVHRVPTILPKVLPGIHHGFIVVLV